MVRGRLHPIQCSRGCSPRSGRLWNSVSGGRRGEAWRRQRTGAIGHTAAAIRHAAAAGIGQRLGRSLRLITGFRRVRVDGESMLPAFRPGDLLLLAPPLWVRPGDVVAVADPRDAERIMVKRVHNLDRWSADVRGDNAAASTDSRQLGPFPRALLAGRVVYRYGPSGRTGWFPGRCVGGVG